MVSSRHRKDARRSKKITCVIFNKCIQTLNTPSNLSILTTNQAISLQEAKGYAKQITMTYEVITRLAPL